MSLTIAKKPYELVWCDMMWLYIEDMRNQQYLGEAGNPSYNTKSQLSAMRFGDEVLIQGVRTSTGTRTMYISANTVAEGFCEAIDCKKLSEIMQEGVHYMYDLKTIIV